MEIHPALRDVFGQRQPLGALLAVLAGGTTATTALVVLAQEGFGAVPWWRAALATLLIWDIACGCLANMTPSTNDYYARRPTHRRVFLAVHIHLVLVAVLLGAPLLPAVAVWAYTIGTAAIVNRLTGSSHQLLVAVTALAGAVVGIPFLLGDDRLMTAVALLFTTKVTVAFAVDHTGSGQQHGARGEDPAQGGDRISPHLDSSRRTSSGSVRS